MIGKPTYEELQSRIRAVADFHNGTLPSNHSLAWEGYIAALLEWGLITPSDHDKLHEMLSVAPAEPVLSIFLGPEGARTAMAENGIGSQDAHEQLQHESVSD